MKQTVASLLVVLFASPLVGCGEQEQQPATVQDPPAETVEAPVVVTAPESGEEDTTAQQAPTETISETEDAPDEEPSPSTVQPSLKLGSAPSGPPTSARFQEGKHYQKIVPAQPTSVGPDKVEVAEVFWYGCGHCYTLDPAIEAWRKKAPPAAELTRVPAMWNDTLRMHARLFYAVEALGKLDTLHPLIFREIHVNGNQLDTVEKIVAFLQQHGIAEADFKSAFSSFAVESKLQRADFLNRRYRVQSVPLMIVNGKYSTDVASAGGEPKLFALLNELVAHESGG